MPRDDRNRAYNANTARISIICLIALAMIIALYLPGCVSAPVSFGTDQQKTIKLPPVPNTATLNINGDNIHADAGGELLLRGYVACRSLGAK